MNISWVRPSECDSWLSWFLCSWRIVEPVTIRVYDVDHGIRIMGIEFQWYETKTW